jgi:hypothetical protein
VGFFDNCRAARATLTAPETIATLDHMEEFFNNGKNWKKGVYSAADGARCLVGAADYAKVSKVDDAKYWLRQAIAERSPNWTIEQYNDNADDYSEIVAVIRRAKEMALGPHSCPRCVRPCLPLVQTARRSSLCVRPLHGPLRQSPKAVQRCGMTRSLSRLSTPARAAR